MSASAPFEGLARLTSAMTPMLDSRSAAAASSAGGAAAAAALTAAKSSTASRAATSARTPSRIESSTVIVARILSGQEPDVRYVIRVVSA